MPATLFDSSAWIALAFSSHPGHNRALATFNKAHSRAPVAICRATQLSFLQPVTTPAIQKAYRSEQITNQLAWNKWQELASLPQVIWLPEPESIEPHWKNFAVLKCAAPKRWMDAYLAAFALSYGITLTGFDRDFASLPELRYRNLSPQPKTP
ncbi:MAG: PIN domain-containing protein [Verrucomicrobia bacterium]|nr:PIN domain-containing protein [Verrucomicrobiota bacterium]